MLCKAMRGASPGEPAFEVAALADTFDPVAAPDTFDPEPPSFGDSDGASFGSIPTPSILVVALLSLPPQLDTVLLR